MYSDFDLLQLGHTAQSYLRQEQKVEICVQSNPNKANKSSSKVTVRKRTIKAVAPVVVEPTYDIADLYEEDSLETFSDDEHPVFVQRVLEERDEIMDDDIREVAGPSRNHSSSGLDVSTESVDNDNGNMLKELTAFRATVSVNCTMVSRLDSLTRAL